MAEKKLLLIYPLNQRISRLWGFWRVPFAPLSLGIIAALTPEDWDIEILDENLEKFEYREADLVGLTAMTVNANRAYEIAGVYRERGIPTVLGGIHGSMLPEEALRHVDTVVAGEAESVWPRVISDFEDGRMDEVYRGDWLELNGMPRPRRDLFSKKYMYGVTQTSRGCPMDCEFCTVTSFNGRRYRQRPVEKVLDEIEMLQGRWLFFLDDNLVFEGRKAQERAIALFNGMVERGIKKSWACQTSLSVADNEEVLEAAARSGCLVMLIGMEAEDPGALSEMDKKPNLRVGVDAYRGIVEKIHRHGIAVEGTFMFGMDSDTREKLRSRTDYILDCGADVVQISPLTPFPGTRMRERMEEEDRLLLKDYPADWDHYAATEVVYRPALMTPDELRAELYDCWRRVDSAAAIFNRARRTRRDTGSADTALRMAILSTVYRRVAKKELKDVGVPWRQKNNR